MNKVESAMLGMCKGLYECAMDEPRGEEFEEFPLYGKFRCRPVGSKEPFGLVYIYRKSLLEARSVAFVLSFIHQVPAQVDIRGEGVGWVPVRRYEMPRFEEIAFGGVS